LNGNVIAYLDNSGQPAAHFQYDPFGNLTVDWESNAADFPYRFSTKPQDPVTGLYYYLYRYYDPLTGRWPSRDPIEERGGVNLYGFVRNDGINHGDFLGLDSVKLRCVKVGGSAGDAGGIHCGILVECGSQRIEFGIGGPQGEGVGDWDRTVGGLIPPEERKVDQPRDNEEAIDYAVECCKNPCEVLRCLDKYQKETQPPPYYALSQNSNSYAHIALEHCACKFKSFQDGTRTVKIGNPKDSSKRKSKKVPNIITEPPGAIGW
jgi:RHS repeat-associated protein